MHCVYSYDGGGGTTSGGASGVLLVDLKIVNAMLCAMLEPAPNAAPSLNV